MKDETKFRIKVDKLLKAIPDSWFESISQRSIRGTPDKIGCINGRFIALEFKTKEKSYLSRLQDSKIKKINKCGGYARVVYPENLNDILEELCSL